MANRGPENRTNPPLNRAGLPVRNRGVGGWWIIIAIVIIVIIGWGWSGGWNGWGGGPRTAQQNPAAPASDAAHPNGATAPATAPAGGATTTSH